MISYIGNLRLVDGGWIEKNAKTKLGIWTIKTSQDVDEDWNYYAKSWHSSHGPKKTISNRKITFTRKHGKGTHSKSLLLDSWSGDYVAKAVIHFNLEPKKSKYPLKLRLNKAFDVKRINTKKGYTFYKRTLLNEIIGYVIVSPDGVIYHDELYKNLVKGLHNKIRNSKRKKEGLVTYNKCRSLGLCKEGIYEFCNVYNLNVKGNYTIKELYKIVKSNIKKAVPFANELKTLAKAYNFNPEFN